MNISMIKGYRKTTVIHQYDYGTAIIVYVGISNAKF